MNKYRIENPNNNKVREYKSRTTEKTKRPATTTSEQDTTTTN